MKMSSSPNDLFTLRIFIFLEENQYFLARKFKSLSILKNKFESSIFTSSIHHRIPFYKKQLLFFSPMNILIY